MPAKPTKSKTVTVKKSPRKTSAKPLKAKTTKPRTVRTAKPIRDAIFVSYSHADREWLDRLRVHLKPLERDHKIEVWHDTKLRSGDKWKTEIDKALAKAKVAIMLVSADFLASDFVQNEELPPLLNAAETEGLTILSILVGRCGFTHSPLSQYQAVNDPALPINNLTKGQADEVFDQISNRVRGIFVSPATPMKAKTRNATLPSAKGKDLSKNLGKTPRKALPVSTNKKPDSRTDAAGNSALLVLETGEWEVVRVKEAKQSKQLELTISQPTQTQRAFLTSLRQGAVLSSVVYRLKLHLCSLADIFTNNVGSQETWRLVLTLKELTRRPGITYGGISPSTQAQALARLLLLNTPLPDQSGLFFGNFHSNTNAQFDHSPLPSLYRSLNRQSAPFKIAATLVITWYLQINDIVEYILKLSLTMKGSSVTVHFEGKRNTQYQNEDQQQNIKIDGTCDLTQDVFANSVKLASYLPYR